MQEMEKSDKHEQTDGTTFSGDLWTNKSRAKGQGWKSKSNNKNKKKPKTIISTETESDESKRLVGSYKNIDSSKIQSFKDFPLSRKTLAGLKDSNYTQPTEIQKESIGLALMGMDILGAAQTGSGKTLAFVVPILESLFTKLWSKEDGLGALIITPTRELAYQIFETLRKVGRRHDFSAGLVIGGKDLKFETKRLDQVNIMICTPGRLLQHMDQNPMFDCTNLQILVLDEADRILDMGFEKDMNAIIANLPVERQTLLFSATQTRSVKDLARLSLKSPAYVSVHENSKFSTPETLTQSYIVSPLDTKLDLLWSFIRHHKKSKILVFLSSCKQVRYAHMLFCRMRPGMSLLALYGTLHQLKRMTVYEDFCKKQSVVLFATDIAARGLDFPEVDWVIQLDCPEDTTTYIHRVGRTARYNSKGEALLVLLPSEESGMIEELAKRKIPIQKIEVNPSRQVTVRRKFEALLARDPTLKECAQRAFKSYLKSVFLMKNKSIFSVEQLDLEMFARSLGLAVAPRVRFLQKKGLINSQPSKSDKNPSSGEESEENEVEDDSHRPSIPTFQFNVEGEEEDDLNDLFIGKKRIEFDDEDDEAFQEDMKPDKSKKPKTKATLAKKLLKKHLNINKKINFDEEGETVSDKRRERQSNLAREYERENESGINIEKAKEILRIEDKFDKEIFRERIREKHKEERKKAKKLKKGSKDDDEEAAFNDGEEDDYQPDLSWMPDPDKIYGVKERQNSDDDEEYFNPNQGSEDEEIKKRSKKRKPTFEGKKSKKSKFEFNTENLDQDTMENLALKLLSSK